MSRPAGSCLVMLSGGLDSAVLLYGLIKRGESPVALTRTAKQAEVRAAKDIATLVGVPHLLLDSRDEVLGLLGAVTCERLQLEEHLGSNAFPHICSLSDSIAFASLLHIPRVLWGWRRSEMHELEQPEKYKDFLAYISLLSHLRGGPIIEAPMFEWSKEQVIRQGLAMGVPLERTYSCIHDLAEPCGVCRRCVERQTALM